MFVFLTLYGTVFTARIFLRWLNLRHLRRHGHEIPAGFEAVIAAEALQRSSAYTHANARFDLLQSALQSILLLLFLLGGWLGEYDRWLISWGTSPLLAGVLFFLGLHYAQTLINLPFHWYHTFHLEERFGFNRTTPGLWLADLIKSEIVATLIFAILSASALGLIAWSAAYWWLWVWVFFAAFTLFLMYIAPFVIEPLFFKFEPLRDTELESAVRDLMHRAGLTVSRVLQVDASRRSSHSNAYFTGIGKVKRIVLFDTLLQQMGRSEVIAVLAHEIGHWRRHHIVKRIAFTQAFGLGALFLAHRVLNWEGLPHWVGETDLTLPARLLLLSILGSLFLFPATPLSSWASRRQELQADDYATEITGTPGALSSALVKLAKDNLANLHPHPLYAWFYYSHPPIATRVARLRQASDS